MDWNPPCLMIRLVNVLPCPSTSGGHRRISGEQLMTLMVEGWLKNDSFSEKKFDSRLKMPSEVVKVLIHLWFLCS